MKSETASQSGEYSVSFINTHYVAILFQDNTMAKSCQTDNHKICDSITVGHLMDKKIYYQTQESIPHH